MAVGFTGFNNITEWELDPSYGELLINANYWGQNQDGSFFSEVLPQTVHNCTMEELGLTDLGGNKFYPPNEASKVFVDLYWKKLLCMR